MSLFAPSVLDSDLFGLRWGRPLAAPLRSMGGELVLVGVAHPLPGRGAADLFVGASAARAERGVKEERT